MNILILSSSKLRHLNLFLEFKKKFNNVIFYTEPSKEKKNNSNNLLTSYFKNLEQIENQIFKDNIKEINTLKKEINYINNLNIPSNAIINTVENSDFIINFGTRYIQDPLIDLLINKKTINIHMGIAPFYRGNASNFWASFDGNFNMIGSTIHYLSKGLDSGRIIQTLSPKLNNMKLKFFSMYSVKTTQEFISNEKYLKKVINNRGIFQNNNLLIKYTKKADFNEEILKEYYKLNILNNSIKKLMEKQNFLKTKNHKLI